MHTVFALLCFVVVIHWLIFPYPSDLLHWHCGNRTIAPVPAKQPWWIWINTSFEFIMNDYITTTKQSTTKPCAYFLGYTVRASGTTLLIWQQIKWRSIGQSKTRVTQPRKSLNIYNISHKILFSCACVVSLLGRSIHCVVCQLKSLRTEIAVDRGGVS